MYCLGYAYLCTDNNKKLLHLTRYYKENNKSKMIRFVEYYNTITFILTASTYKLSFCYDSNYSYNFFKNRCKTSDNFMRL